MLALPLTPLTQISQFTEPIRATLAQYWITSAEEFAATARLDNASYQDGLAAMGAQLALPAETMEELYKAAIAGSPRAGEYSALAELDVGTGLILDDLPLPSGLDFVAPSDLPLEVLLPHNLPILDQGSRNACVAFTMVAMLQILSGDPTDLSEQFLFWGCKELDGMPSNPHGTQPQAAIDALKQFGICLESEWPYNAFSIPDNVGQGPPPPKAKTAALARRIVSGGSLESTKSAGVCSALAEGKPVLLGVPVYPFWTGSGQARRGGRVRRPLPGELPGRGHAICAVGYREDPTAPGGGYVIFRNSWGTDFGSENHDGIGYGYIPYELLDTESRCAYVIDSALSGASHTQSL
jgi:hypothetical protein